MRNRAREIHVGQVLPASVDSDVELRDGHRSQEPGILVLGSARRVQEVRPTPLSFQDWHRHHVCATFLGSTVALCTSVALRGQLLLTLPHHRSSVSLQPIL